MELMRRHAVAERLPERRAVVEFAFRDAGDRRWWLVVRRPEASLCREHPGVDADVHVVTDTATLVGMYLGHVALAAAATDGRLELYGEPELVRTLPRWLVRSAYRPPG
jgi:SCP-2 sterol transfer family